MKELLFLVLALIPFMLMSYDDESGSKNHCKDNPCLSDAPCLDGADSYTCECLDGFDGINC
jgi:EGF-like domain